MKTRCMLLNHSLEPYLQAACKAIKQAAEHEIENLVIRTDSQFMINCKYESEEHLFSVISD